MTVPETRGPVYPGAFGTAGRSRGAGNFERAGPGPGRGRDDEPRGRLAAGPPIYHTGGFGVEPAEDRP